MRKKFDDIHFEKAILMGEPAIFTFERTDRESIPKGLHMYEVRHTDSSIHKPYSIANNILVNFYGTLISPIDLELGDNVGDCILYKKKAEHYDGPRISGAEFYEEVKDQIDERIEQSASEPDHLENPNM